MPLLIYLHYLNGSSKIIPAVICILQLNQYFICNYSECDPGRSTRLKVKELHSDDDSSSLSRAHSSENDDNSYIMDVKHQGVMVGG